MREKRAICGGVYSIVNTVTQDEIIGSTRDFHKRWKQYVYFLRRGQYTNHLLQSAWDTYGEQSFLFEPLLVLDPANLTRNKLRQAEQRFFEERKPVYNLSKNAFGGAAPTGTQWSYLIPQKYALWGYFLIGPDDQEVYVPDLNVFADQRGLHRAGLYKLVRRRIGSHLGWRLAEEGDAIFWACIEWRMRLWGYL